MVLRSLSYMIKELDPDVVRMIYDEVNKLDNYFYKVAGHRAQEAKAKTLTHAILNYSPNLGMSPNYLMAVAKDILKERNIGLQVDFLEDTAVDTDENIGSLFSIVDDRASNFESEVLDRAMPPVDVLDCVNKFALEYMPKFMSVCRAIDEHVLGNSNNYSTSFKKYWLKLNDEVPDFTKTCVALYRAHKRSMYEFINLTNYSKIDKNLRWHEADYNKILKRTHKTYRLLDTGTREEVYDADLQAYALNRELSKSMKMYRVRYFELWDSLCGQLESDTGVTNLKFVLGDHHIYKTPGGTWSQLDGDICDMYEALRSEIVTNILNDSRGYLLHAGSEFVYLLCNIAVEPLFATRKLFSDDVKFEYEDISDKVSVIE